MKFIIAIILTALLSFTIGLFTILPWYSFMVGVAAVAWGIHQKPSKAFLSGFIALFSLWLLLAFLKDNGNNHILATKVAYILPLQGSYVLLLLITALIGGLLGGFAALTGSFLRKEKRKSSYY